MVLRRFWGRPEDRERTRQGVRKSRETWFGRIRGLFGGRADGPSWEEVEEILIGADVGVRTALALVERVRERARREGVRDPDRLLALLKEEMLRILRRVQEGFALPLPGENAPTPLAVLVVGVNGSGKTTTVAKLAHLYRTLGKRVLIAASDTFRAGAIEQVKEWAQRVGAEVVAHRAGADPAAVAHDALQACRSRGVDLLLVDTAGRLHTRTPLMEELRKVRRVLRRLDPSAPHHTWLVLDATTGQNGLAQARQFLEAVGVSAVVLAKLDGTAKGGIVLSIAEDLGLPVAFLGTGEGPQDLAPFDPEAFVDALFEPDAEPARRP